jgi:hypothetical protein
MVEVIASAKEVSAGSHSKRERSSGVRRSSSRLEKGKVVRSGTPHRSRRGLGSGGLKSDGGDDSAGPTPRQEATGG